MKNIKYFLYTIALLTVVGCSDFEELNLNPNEPTTVSSGVLFTSAILRGPLPTTRATRTPAMATSPKTGGGVSLHRPTKGGGVTIHRGDHSSRAGGPTTRTTWGRGGDGRNAE